MIVYYSAREDGHRFMLDLDGSYTLMEPDDASIDELADVAQFCAEDWHSNHDGWEAQWPRTFALYASKEGPALAHFEVDCEMVPSFSATCTA